LALRERNTEAAYCAVTEAVFKVISKDFEYEADLRLKLLSALAGISVPVASAILALSEPQKYCVIDFRGWHAVFGEKRENFGVREYLRYRDEVARLARELGLTIQETDALIWEYDRRLKR